MAILILNVGWMQHYAGLMDDEINDGGAFIQENNWGGEIFNFLPFEGFMYGFVQPPGRENIPYNNRIIRIERLGAIANAPFVEGVLVGWAARKPEGGTYVVGWYENAIVFKRWQDPPQGAMREHGGEPIGYYVRAAANNCILLPPNERMLRVPKASAPENRGRGGIGQANLWFADSGRQNDLEFTEHFQEFIQAF